MVPLQSAISGPYETAIQPQTWDFETAASIFEPQKGQSDAVERTDYVRAFNQNAWNTHQEFFRSSIKIHLFTNAIVTKLFESNGVLTSANVAFRSTNMTIRAKQFALACGGLNNLRTLAMIESSRPKNQILSNAGSTFLEHPTVRSVRFASDVAMDLSFFMSNSQANSHQKSGFAFSVNNREVFLKFRSEMDLKKTFEKVSIKAKNAIQFLQSSTSKNGSIFERGVAWIRMADLADSKSRNSMKVMTQKEGLPSLHLNYDISENLLSDRQIFLSQASLFLRQKRLAFCYEDDRYSKSPKKHFALASHPSGTTPFGADPKHSVVNLDFRHHHIRNLHIMGSSLFTKVGCYNPTLSIVALALRKGRELTRNIG
jgi:hypothetical protein